MGVGEQVGSSANSASLTGLGSYLNQSLSLSQFPHQENGVRLSTSKDPLWLFNEVTGEKLSTV